MNHYLVYEVLGLEPGALCKLARQALSAEYLTF